MAEKILRQIFDLKDISMTKVKLDSALIAATCPIALEGSVVKGNGYRVTVLTSRLFRIETSKTNKFIDTATQSVWFRNLETPKFTVEKNDTLVKIITEDITLLFSPELGNAKVVFKNGKTADCNNKKNLKGTMRTLDMNFGIYRLGDGIIGKNGVAVYKDDTLILNNAGEIEPRRTDTVDKYIFAYGQDYRAALKDFFRITGGVPMVPRFALGNWWSRYRAYTQKEYTDLMQKFIDRKIPITVATVDMDWHWVNINERFGTDYKARYIVQSPGWTGYSWNTDLFPDYKAFLRWLKERGYKVTLNLHPAEGVRHFEDMYDQMAVAMGVDPETKTDIPFDITDNNFINNYFKVVNHPYEKDGVDFWWLDWQQGKKTKMQGLDPLWSLNHYFTLDNAREHRPLILSRYAGVGSHRYPLGFSGDTFMLWSSLKKQPYFTNNAANVGYSWWSHDIGGHMFGVRDDEMYLRWVQYGVFSPINRLHSSSSDLTGKEPWAYRADVCHYAEEALKLRHSLIPYIYTMNYKTHTEGLPLCEPMYYGHPADKESYKVPNQYMFGSELMVCPIVTKMNKKTGTASVKAWLPRGRWTDIFTGHIYNGNRYLKLFRGEPSIPVLAKEGAIIPMSADEGNSVKNPVNLDIMVSRGNNEFVLYEDEGEDNNYDKVFAKTKMAVSEDADIIDFTIDKAEGDYSILPETRNYKVKFIDVESGEITVMLNGNVVSKNTFAADPVAEIVGVKPDDKVRVIVSDYTISANITGAEAIARVMARWQKGFIWKSVLYTNMRKLINNRNYRAAVKSSILPERIKEEIYEYLD